MLYASVLKLNRKASKTLQIKDLYSLHRVVYSLFEDTRTAADKNASVPSGIQWVDKGGDARTRTILMLSDRLPRPSEPILEGLVNSKPITDAFFKYTHYRFEVVLNPTQREKQTGKIRPIVGREAIASWFQQRAEANWGFSVQSEHFQIDRIDVNTFTAKTKVTLQQAKVSGYLTVIDSSIFKRSFECGIGRSRSFGCGLLQVVPTLEPSYF